MAFLLDYVVDAGVFKDHTHACTHTHTQPSHLTAFTFYHSGHSQHSVSDQGHSRLLQKVCREGEGGLVEVDKEVVQR